MCSINNLAIIGASYLQLPLIEKAKEMGFTTHVFAWAANDVGEAAADYFYPISIIEVDKITEQCRKIGICGICSIATDLGNYAVNYVANQLGLTGNTMDCTLKSTNKHLMRKAFEANGDPSPKSMLITPETDLDSLSSLSYPIIVKPTDRSGSRGIFKLENPENLAKAVQEAIDASFEKKALIEEFVEGQEYSVEGITFNGEHHILAVTLKYTTGAPHFIEIGHLEPAPLEEATYKKIISVVNHALNSLGIRNGASHSEIKINENGNIKIIEIGSRMGGGCIGSDLVYCSTGVDYVKAVIDIACGRRPDLSVKHMPYATEVIYILNNDDLKVYRELQRRKPDRILKLVYLNEGLLGKTTDDSNRAGCYIVRKEFLQSITPPHFYLILKQSKLNSQAHSILLSQNACQNAFGGLAA